MWSSDQRETDGGCSRGIISWGRKMEMEGGAGQTNEQTSNHKLEILAPLVAVVSISWGRGKTIFCSRKEVETQQTQGAGRAELA